MCLVGIHCPRCTEVAKSRYQEPGTMTPRPAKICTFGKNCRPLHSQLADCDLTADAIENNQDNCYERYRDLLDFRNSCTKIFAPSSRRRAPMPYAALTSTGNTSRKADQGNCVDSVDTIWKSSIYRLQISRTYRSSPRSGLVEKWMWYSGLCGVEWPMGCPSSSRIRPVRG